MQISLTLVKRTVAKIVNDSRGVAGALVPEAHPVFFAADMSDRG